MHSERLTVVKEVEQKKAKLSKQHLLDATKRSRLTTFTAKKKADKNLNLF